MHTVQKSAMYDSRVKVLLEMYNHFKTTGEEVVPLTSIKGSGKDESARFLITRLRANQWIYPNALKLDEITGYRLSDKAMDVIEACDMDQKELRDYMVRSNGKIVNLDQ